MTNRTLIYARVSTEDQLEKYGLPSQLRACREYAAAHGLIVIEEITDDGISGTILDRPGLARVRRMVADSQIDVVVMLDADRLSRELGHLLILKPEIDRKARMEFVAAKFEDSPSGRLFFSIRGAVSQYERELIRERTMRGMRERARNGLVAGCRIAYGYRYEQGHLIPDEARAGTIREIFNWYDSGFSMRGIALNLRKARVPSWTGRQWGHSSVKRILNNETYAGVAYFGVHRWDEKKKLTVRPESEHIRIPVPAVVSREQWERVQGRIAANPNLGAPSANYLLRGLLYCECGRRMHGEQSKQKWRSYRCAGRDSLRYSGEPCNRHVSSSQVDAAVWEEILHAFTSAQFLRGLLSAHQDALRGNAPVEQLERLAAQARKLERKEKTCLDALLDPDLIDGRDAIKAEYRKTQQERRRIQREIAAIEQAERSALSAGEWLEETTGLLAEYLPSLVAPGDKQAFVRGLVSRADWTGNEVRLRCFLGPQLCRTSAHCAQFQPLQVVVTARVAA